MDPAVLAKQSGEILEPLYEKLIKVSNISPQQGQLASDTRGSSVMKANPFFLLSQTLSLPILPTALTGTPCTIDYSSISTHLTSLYHTTEAQQDLATLFQQLLSEFYAFCHYFSHIPLYEKSKKSQNIPQFVRLWDIFQLILVHYQVCCQVFQTPNQYNNNRAVVIGNQYDIIHYTLTHLCNITHCSVHGVRSVKLNELELEQFYDTVFHIKHAVKLHNDAISLLSDEERETMNSVKYTLNEFLPEINSSIFSRLDGELITWFNRSKPGDISLLASSANLYNPHTPQSLNLPHYIQTKSEQPPTQIDMSMDSHQDGYKTDPTSLLARHISETLSPQGTAQNFKENTSLLHFVPLPQQIIYYLQCLLIKILNYMREFLQRWTCTDRIYACQFLQAMICLQLPTHLHFLVLDSIGQIITTPQCVHFSTFEHQDEDEDKDEMNQNSPQDTKNQILIDVTSPFTSSVLLPQASTLFYNNNCSIFQYFLQSSLHMIQITSPLTYSLAYSPAACLSAFAATNMPSLLFGINSAACSRLLHPFTNYLFTFNAYSIDSTWKQHRLKENPSSLQSLSSDVFWVIRFVLYIIFIELRQRQQFTTLEWVSQDHQSAIANLLQDPAGQPINVHCSPSPIHAYSHTHSPAMKYSPFSESLLTSALVSPYKALIKVRQVHRDQLTMHNILAHYDKIEQYLDQNDGKLPANVSLQQILIPTHGFKSLVFLSEPSTTGDYNTTMNFHHLIEEKKNRIVSKLQQNSQHLDNSIEVPFTTTNSFSYLQVFHDDGRTLVDLCLDVLISMIKHNSAPTFHIEKDVFHHIFQLLFAIDTMLFRGVSHDRSLVYTSPIQGLFDYMFPQTQTEVDSTKIFSIFLETNILFYHTEYFAALAPSGTVSVQQYLFNTSGITLDTTEALSVYTSNNLESISNYNHNNSNMNITNTDENNSSNNSTISSNFLQLAAPATTFYFPSHPTLHHMVFKNIYHNLVRVVHTNLQSTQLCYYLNQTNLFPLLYFFLSAHYHVKRVNRRRFHLQSMVFTGSYNEDLPMDQLETLDETMREMPSDQFDPFISSQASKFTQQSALWVAPVTNLSPEAIECLYYYHQYRTQPDDAKEVFTNRQIHGDHCKLPEIASNINSFLRSLLMLVGIFFNLLTLPPKKFTQPTPTNLERLQNPLIISLLVSGNLSKFFFFLSSLSAPRMPTSFSPVYQFFWSTTFPILRVVKDYISSYNLAYKTNQSSQEQVQYQLPNILHPFSPSIQSGLYAIYVELLANIIQGNCHTYHDTPWLDGDSDCTVRECYEPMLVVDSLHDTSQLQLDTPDGLIAIALQHSPPSRTDFSELFSTYHVINHNDSTINTTNDSSASYRSRKNSLTPPSIIIPICIDFHGAVTQHCIELFIDLLLDEDSAHIISSFNFDSVSEPVEYTPISNCSKYNSSYTPSASQHNKTIINAPTLFDLLPQEAHCLSHINRSQVSSKLTYSSSPVSTQFPLHEVIQIPTKPVHFGFVHNAIEKFHKNQNPLHLHLPLESFYSTFNLQTSLNLAYQMTSNPDQYRSHPFISLFAAMSPVSSSDLLSVPLSQHTLEPTLVWKDIVDTMPKIQPLSNRVPATLYNIIKPSNQSRTTHSILSLPPQRLNYAHKNYPVADPPHNEMLTPENENDQQCKFVPIENIPTTSFIAALEHINGLYSITPP